MVMNSSDPNLKPRHWTIGKAADYLEEQGYRIPVTTLRHWFNELEKNNVHVLTKSSNRNERILTESDLEIAKFIYQQKEAYGFQMNVKALGALITEKFADYVTPGILKQDLDHGPGNFLIDEQKIRDYLAEQIKIEVSAIKKQLEEEHKERLALMPSREEQEERLRAIATSLQLQEIRKRKELRRRAEDLWNKNPAKIGILFKREDLAKKAEFIKAYEDEHIEDELKT
ncbi:hypothetical protein AV654_19520 [Paenibacillus elgii]|uniref:MerR family transcriptional regulator n=1 Tax=Paenibacillus elgii TaxID=189691 RepID=A0A163XN74_9BACL|nr:hypothetical protein [Paenibacillus elgii]KZE78167.1 hypothetical protein AV654_19520 [Paenibacillus elgii]